MSTRQFLASVHPGDDPLGDLIADMRRDANLPRTFCSQRAVSDYLRRRNACREAIACAPAFWRDYRRWLHPREPVKK